jgi:SAM-dependent methyltransferase
VSMDPEIRNHYSHYYDEGATEWRRLGALDKSRNIVKLCGLGKFDDVLEIGAGDGAILEQLSELGFAQSLSALEVSESAVKAIADRNINNLRDAKLFDGYSTDYKDNSFDLVVLSHVVEHVEHPRQLLREVSRIGKALYVEVPLELRLRTPRNFKWDSTGHINIYSPVIIRQLLQSTGLEIIKEKVSLPSYAIHRFAGGDRGSIQYWIKRLALRTSSFAATQMFTYHWSALCRPISN